MTGSTTTRAPQFVLGTIPLARLSEETAVELIIHALKSGVSIIDTARAYGDAEAFTGKALKNYYAAFPEKIGSVTITSKSMARTAKELKNDLHESLKQLQVDYIDWYFLHQIDSFVDLQTVSKEDGALSEIRRAKEQGLIKYIGVSGHFTPVLNKAVEELPLDVLLGRFNLTTGPKEIRLIEKARKKGLKIASMKVFEGGFITKNINLCLRQAASNALVDYVLVGCDSIAQFNENYATLNERKPLTTDEEKALLKRAAQLKDHSFCSSCGYCTASCPKEIPVAHVFNIKGKLSVYGGEYGFKGSPGAAMYLSEMIGAIDLCDECGECEKHCPNKLPIRKLIKAEQHKFADYLGNGEKNE